MKTLLAVLAVFGLAAAGKDAVFFETRIRPHVFYISGTYELPFFRTNKILGGWQVAGIGQFRAGTPFGVGYNPTQAGWLGGRANVVNSDLYPANKNIEGWFNPASFAVPTPFTFGNSARNMLFGPGQKIIDVSVLKDFRFGENHFVQFRAEAFNMPNTPNFGNPASNLSVPAAVGRIRGTTVAARAIQFGLKFVF